MLEELAVHREEPSHAAWLAAAALGIAVLAGQAGCGAGVHDAPKPTERASTQPSDEARGASARRPEESLREEGVLFWRGRPEAYGSALSAPGDVDQLGSSLAVSGDGRFLVVGAPGCERRSQADECGGGVVVFERRREGFTRVAAYSAPRFAAFGASVATDLEGRHVLVGFRGGVVDLARDDTGRLTADPTHVSLPDEGGPPGLAVSDDGRWLVAAMLGQTSFYERVDGHYVLLDSLSSGGTLAMSRDGQVALLGPPAFAREAEARVVVRHERRWELTDRFAIPGKGLVEVAVSPDGATLAFSSVRVDETGFVRIARREGEHYRVVSEVDAPRGRADHFGDALAFAGDGETLFVARTFGGVSTGEIATFDHRGESFVGGRVLRPSERAKSTWAAPGSRYGTRIAASRDHLFASAPWGLSKPGAVGVYSFGPK